MESEGDADDSDIEELHRRIWHNVDSVTDVTEGASESDQVQRRNRQRKRLKSRKKLDLLTRPKPWVAFSY